MQGGEFAGSGSFSTLQQNRTLAPMDRRRFRDVLTLAAETRTASLMAQAEARRERAAWEAWRALWATLQLEPPPARMLTVCMYCERFRGTTGEWVLAAQALREMLRDPKLVQVTHGSCPICLAGHMDAD